MKLVDLSITEFAKVLGSDAPAPGGGSAAALSAANGISLTKMVCELTIGKKKYAEFEDHIKGVHEKKCPPPRPITRSHRQRYRSFQRGISSL